MAHYSSKTTLLGLPLFDLAVGPQPGRQGFRGVARGWIAVGDVALGPLLAVGGVAGGGIAIGGLAVGGVLAFAGFAVGSYATGGFAAGLWAVGGCALAWLGAAGGAAISNAYAIGGLAIAPHANDEAAKAYFANSAFVRSALSAARSSPWVIVAAVALLVLLAGKRQNRPAPGPTEPR